MALAYKTETITKEEKKELIDKLNRIEGRIRGIGKMVEDDRQVEDIMMQVTATYESLRVAMKSLIKKHMEEFVTKGLISTNQQKRDEAYNQLINDLFKYTR
ncbi:MAG: metal-sensitive transcriptional regulator [Candidatus Marinamargulisbacteria bacterium]